MGRDRAPYSKVTISFVGGDTRYDTIILERADRPPESLLATGHGRHRIRGHRATPTRQSTEGRGCEEDGGTTPSRRATAIQPPAPRRRTPRRRAPHPAQHAGGGSILHGPSRRVPQTVQTAQEKKAKKALRPAPAKGDVSDSARRQDGGRGRDDVREEAQTKAGVVVFTSSS
jgi:hypothetical protein